MPTLFESTRAAARRFVCQSTVDGNALVEWIDNFAAPYGGGRISRTPAGRFGAAAGTALRGIACPASTEGQSAGGVANVTYPPVVPPTGQCPTLYEVTIQGTFSTERCDNGVIQENPGFSFTANNVLGPLGGVVTSPTGTACGGGQSGVDIFIESQDPGGLTFVGNATTNFPSQVKFFSWETTGTTFTTEDGSPDDCGGPGVQNPPTGTDTIDYDDPDGNPVTDEPITFNPTFPVFAPNGDIIIPINVVVGGLQFNINFNLGNLEISFDFGDGSPASETCCPPTEEPEEDDGPEEQPDEPENELRFWGVLARPVVSPTANVTVVGDGTGPDTYLPDLGWVRFAIEIGGYRGWSEKVEIQTIPQFVPVPASAVAYAFDVHARPGVTIDTFPVIVQGTDTTSP